MMEFFVKLVSSWKLLNNARKSSILAVVWSNGLVVIGVLCSKPMGGSKVDSAFHPSEVGKMSTRSFWELSGKK